jgi:hypothetical protein
MAKWQDKYKIRIVKYRDQIEDMNKRKALGYENTLDFNFGYIACLFRNKLITRSEYNKLIKVFASVENNDGYWFIENDGEINV